MACTGTYTRAMRSTTLVCCAVTAALASSALADSQNTATVNVLPNFSGGSGPYYESHTQLGYVSAAGSATGGAASSGQASCEANYGFARGSCQAAVSLNSSCSGTFRDKITVTSPSVPNGTVGTLTYSVKSAGSLSATGGTSGASWQLQADLGGGAFDINRGGTQYSPELGGAYAGDAMGMHSATISFTYGFELQLHVQLNVSASAANSAQSSGGAAAGSPFIVNWQGMGNFTANGNPVNDVVVSSVSGTNWTGSISGAPCPADLNGDGLVDGADLGALLGQWGSDGSADLNGDHVVDGADLGALLGAWGSCG